MRILVTGGAGFIGSAVVRHLIERTEHRVLNIDKLTYAASPASLTQVEASPRYSFREDRRLRCKGCRADIPRFFS